MTHGGWDYGDTYADEVMRSAIKVAISNPRTVPTRDEMKDQSLGVLKLGGEVDLYLVRKGENYFFCKDGGDLTSVSGTTIEEAVEQAKLHWPQSGWFANAHRTAGLESVPNPPADSWIDHEIP
jgi:hypothetical protein